MPISIATPERNGLARPLGTLVRGALDHAGWSAGEIGIVLTDDAVLRRLNRRFRGIDRATDVLSFAYHESPGPRERRRRAHGDIVVSLDRVRAQAVRFRVSRGEELGRVIVHGALHLAGLDHRTTPERRHMRAAEHRVLGLNRAAIRACERALDGAGRRRRA